MPPFFAGLLLATAGIASARRVGFDRDAAFYPTVLIVIALLYVLFGAIDGRPSVIVTEVGVALPFLLVAISGYRGAGWWLVAGFALHGVFDALHPRIVTNGGVPGWWPAFCLGFDGVVAAYLGLRTWSTAPPDDQR